MDHGSVPAAGWQEFAVSLFLIDRTELDVNSLNKLHGESVQLSKQTSDTDKGATLKKEKNSNSQYGCAGNQHKGILELDLMSKMTQR